MDAGVALDLGHGNTDVADNTLEFLKKTMFTLVVRFSVGQYHSPPLE